MSAAVEVQSIFIGWTIAMALVLVGFSVVDVLRRVHDRKDRWVESAIVLFLNDDWEPVTLTEPHLGSGVITGWSEPGKIWISYPLTLIANIQWSEEPPHDMPLP